MKKILNVLALSVALLFSPACLMVDAQYPLDDDYNNTDLGTKVGQSSAHSVLWIVAWGDAGSNAAAKDGNIKVLII